jgi:hypothetical protein
MPKLSFTQQVARLEGELARARSNAQVLPPLALAVADELEGHIAALKEIKLEQQAYHAASMAKTEELMSLISRGELVARQLRAYIVLALGTKDRRLSQFGIQIRRRRRRKVRRAPATVATPAANVSGA